MRDPALPALLIAAALLVGCTDSSSLGPTSAKAFPCRPSAQPTGRRTPGTRSF